MSNYRNYLMWSLLCSLLWWFNCSPASTKKSCFSDADCMDNEQCIQGFCNVSNRDCQPGQKRACYTGPAGTKGRGVCRDGSQVCTPNGTWPLTCDGEVLPSEELCDGQDNNCDGIINNIQATVEICDGIDNDCDGQIDNVKGTREPLTQPCYTGSPETVGRGPCKEGLQTCRNGKWSGCEGEVVPRPEICNNGIDDDCDGRVDNVEEGKPCTDSNRKGICQQGVTECGPGGTLLCKQVVQPREEDCNGIDDDCDGRIDNIKGSLDPLSRKCPYTGPAGTENVGVCRAGNQTCQNGKWSNQCFGEIKPQAEICNGVDDNCNGQIDENITRPCYTGPKGTENQGICKPGVETCHNGKWGECIGQVLPQEELCESKTDEDCDGRIDNVLHLGEKCLEPKRHGACQQGIFECKNNNRVCTQITFPSTEICDGIDNDCDGYIDNIKGTNKPMTRSCYEGQPNTENVGRCRAGTQSCILGNWGPCENQILPQLELCNGQDDNCNKQIDEDNACSACGSGSSRPCYIGPIDTRGRGRCRDGQEICQNSKWSGQCIGAITPQPETCNNQDDDCDGHIDNQPNSRDPLQRSCYTGPANTRTQGSCADGIELCQNGQWTGQCLWEITPKPEICDGKDNNCNGQIDEDRVCQTSYRDVGEICSRDPGSPEGQRCKGGLLCIQSNEMDPASYCYQVCTTAADCAQNQDGRRTCITLNQNVSICVAQADQGAPCDVDSGRLCKSGLICDLQLRVCRRPSEALPLARCGGQTGQDCDSKHLCLPLTPGSRNTFCLAKCTRHSECDSGTCLQYANGINACLPLGTLAQDQTCGRGDSGNQIELHRYCAKNLICTRFDPANPDGICLPMVTACNACDSSRLCIAIGGNTFFACAKICGTCPGSQRCTPVSPGISICTPPIPTGSVPFGGICDASRLCQPQMICLFKDPSATEGFCAKYPCNSNADCPKIPAGSICQVILTSGEKACIFPCQTNRDCPSPMVCDFSQVCVAP